MQTRSDAIHIGGGTARVGAKRSTEAWRGKDDEKVAFVLIVVTAVYK